MLEALKAQMEARTPRLFGLVAGLFNRAAARNSAEPANLLPFLVTPGDRACDIGANNGLFTFWMLRLGVQVEAFEPNPRLARVLDLRFAAARRAGRFRLFACALSDGTGPATLHVPRGLSPLASIDGDFVAHSTAPVDHVTIARRTLDDCIEGRVDFLKIDVEGHEAKVLAGASRLLAESRPTLLVEAEERHHAGAVTALEGLLAPLGYEGFFCADGAVQPLARFDPALHQRPGALNAQGTRVQPGATYVNNFVFIARADRKARFMAWRPGPWLARGRGNSAAD
ncbi:methyltransferase [Azorhizobium caulinodans ORS 571]|uniref:Methyltransferase n=1 Tax=Azorhizobium caulinodans (strain ATCC 43989 / DSM 5975 / JCM 20966 / LMG 6465 / NBRC 14845 / NCIMB 13405 / ORS 571) TaxID=438753 RepID=A8HRH8_AZOC5|nr:FkbM family methyltransferase [Azorhizobium caulinodans]BAF87188.1 methyltransferase [Azorhizobium caulinodans ORS 571]